MKVFSTLAVAAGLVASVSAHTRVFGVYVNDVFQGDGQNVYIRSPFANSPVKDISSSNIVCNTNNVPVAKKVPAKAGDKVTFEWFHDTRGDDIIDPSHKGPIMLYIAPLASNGNGAVWSKIGELGYTNGRWAVDDLIANRGKVSFTLPAALKAGDYLLRAEVIALHEADTNFRTNAARGAQFYPSCSQFTISGGGSAVPNQNFNFIGGYTPTSAGILFNLYSNVVSYPFPGPAVWVPSASAPIVPKPVGPKPTPKPVTPKPTYAPKPTTMVTKTTKKGGHHSTGGHHKPTKAPTPPTYAVPVAKFGQCGGKMFTGSKVCAAGSTCRYQNDYYSQCL